MLYIQSLLDDWAFPATDPQVRARWEPGWPRSASRQLHAELARRRPGRRRGDPAHRRPAHRARTGGGGADRPAVRRVGAGHRRTPRWDTADHRIGLGHERSRRAAAAAHRRDVRRRSGRRGARAAGRGLRDGVTASRALGYAQVLAALDAGRTTTDSREARELTFIGDPSLRAPAALVVPPRPPHHWLDGAAPGQRATRSLAALAATYPEQVKFAKGHGTQNDFVVLPDLDAGLRLTPAAVAALCDRRRGLGADGVLRVTTAGAAREPACSTGCPRASAADDWFMDYRNADGSVAQMCGNGVRVFAHYLRASGLERRDEFVVGSLAGPRPVVVHSARRADRRRHRRHGQGQPVRHR